MLDIIVFAIITAVLFWKLKGILGKEDENFTPKKMNFDIKDVTNIAKNAKEKVLVNNLIEPKKDSKEELENEILNNLALIPAAFHENYRVICKILPTGVFNIKTFLDGVETIFVELINSQNTKDITNIEGLMSSGFKTFFQAFLEGQKTAHPLQMINLVTISSIEFTSFAVERDPEITLKISSEQLRYEKDGEKILSGSINIPSNFIDFLTFTRDVKSNSWFLTKIK